METTYLVSGMTCNHCASSVSEEIYELDGVTEVSVDIDSGAVVVTSDRAIDLSAVGSAVAEAGYTLTSSS